MRSFILPVRVYLEDTDAQGIVYNASYFQFFERARTEWLRANGIDHNRLRESAGISLVLVRIEVSFRIPAKLGDLLHVSAELARVGGARFVFNQNVRLELSDGENFCYAVSEVACVDAKTGKPQRLPKSIIADLRIDEPEK